jgi:hypothetical protein
MDGVHEEAAEFINLADPFAGTAKFRTFGADGPMYEVIEVKRDCVRIYLYNSDEEIDYRLVDALADPLAH